MHNGHPGNMCGTELGPASQSPACPSASAAHPHSSCASHTASCWGCNSDHLTWPLSSELSLAGLVDEEPDNTVVSAEGEGGRDCQGLPTSLIFFLKTREPGGAPRAHVAERDCISQLDLQLPVVMWPSPSQWDASEVM